MARLANVHPRGRMRGIGVVLAVAVSVLAPVALLGAADPSGATAVAPNPGPIAEVAIGPTSACSLSQSGVVACWGDNTYGQLGDGSTTDSTRPIPITTAGTPLATKTVAHVYVGNGRACALTTDGALACWGQNTYGQLGTGGTSNSSLPKAAVGALVGATVVDVAIGNGHSCAVTSAGAAVCWGGNGNGQVGNGTFTTATTPTAVTAAGTPMEGQNIVQVTAGGAHTCAISNDGVAYCWGFGGKLGNGGAANDNQTKPVAVTTTGTPLAGKFLAEIRAGESHTCARATDGTLACWGTGTSGQLGSGTYDVFTSALVPVAVKTTANALTGKTATQLTAGDSHTCVRTSDGTAACWGADSRSQLGDRGTTSVGSAVAVDPSGTNLGASIAKVAAGGSSTCAISGTGALGCWGFNHTGQLGRGTEGQSKVPAAAVSGVLTGQAVQEVAGGYRFACARTASSVACWGSNTYGQLGDGTTTDRNTPVAVATAGTALAGKGIADLAVGSYHACALADDGTVACWGRGASGRLGAGSTTNRSTPGAITTAGTALDGKTITTIAAGGSHSCAAASDGTVACWGFNSYGQVGDGTTTGRTVPTAVTRPGSPLEGHVAVQLVAGNSHTCARTDAQGLTCWGDGDFGLLGTGVTSGAPDALTPVAVTTTGTPLAGKAISHLTAGWYHNCVTTTDGVAACWGYNGDGQIGNGNSTSVSVPTAVTTAGALGDGPVGTIEANGHHTCATGGATGAVCFGAQVNGSLGIGTNTARSTSPVAVATTGTPLAGTNIAGLAQMYTGSCAITSNGVVSCWGANADGQLGNGTPSSEPVPAPPLWAGAGPVVPGAPTISGVVRGNQQADLAWSAPVSDGGSAITGYLITPYIDGAAQPSVTTTGTGTTKTVTGLTNGTPYTFKVAATNMVGTGAQSAASSAVTPATVPGAPSFKTYTRGDQSVSMSWYVPASDGGSPITGYVITPYIGGAAQTPVDVAGTGTNHVVTGLTNGTSYTFRLAARNAVGVGATTTTVFAIAPAGVPAAPSITSAVAGDAQATLTWTGVGGNGSTISGYVITPFIGDVAQTPIDSTGAGTTKVITGLANGTTYTFTVAATNAVGTGAASATSSPVTPTGDPSAPSILSAVRGNQQVALTWAAPTNNGGSPITGYTITHSIGGVAQTPIASAGTGTSKVITGLANGTAYTFEVAASTVLGTGPKSAASALVTPATLPGAPSIGAVTSGNGTANVSWSAPASNGGDPLTGYVITPSIGGVAQPPVVSSGSGTTFVVSGLTNGTTYTFIVAARNGVGDGAPSSASAAVTPDAPAPFASWLLFVRRQHQDLTNALPSPGVENAEINALASGITAKGDLDDSLRRGPENLANVDPVVRVYRAFLGRAPDAGGLKFWIARKRNVAPAKTWTVTQIATEFTNSNEFKTKYGSLTNRQFVTRIYTDVLGRTADPSGVDYWTRQLDTKKKTKAQVMVGFSESNEYRTKQAQNTDVAVAYTYLLGRAPTSSEASDWVTRQKAGTSHAALLTELLDSAAYATHVSG